jgi:hypothetical protein
MNCLRGSVSIVPNLISLPARLDHNLDLAAVLPLASAPRLLLDLHVPDRFRVKAPVPTKRPKAAKRHPLLVVETLFPHESTNVTGSPLLLRWPVDGPATGKFVP